MIKPHNYFSLSRIMKNVDDIELIEKVACHPIKYTCRPAGRKFKNLSTGGWLKRARMKSLTYKAVNNHFLSFLPARTSVWKYNPPLLTTKFQERVHRIKDAVEAAGTRRKLNLMAERQILLRSWNLDCHLGVFFNSYPFCQAIRLILSF